MVKRTPNSSVKKGHTGRLLEGTQFSLIGALEPGGLVIVGKNSKFVLIFSLFCKKNSYNSVTIYHLKMALFLRLLTQDSEYVIDFLKFFREHWETDPNVQVAKMTNFGIFYFFILKTPR